MPTPRITGHINLHDLLTARCLPPNFRGTHALPLIADQRHGVQQRRPPRSILCRTVATVPVASTRCPLVKRGPIRPSVTVQPAQRDRSRSFASTPSGIRSMPEPRGASPTSPGTLTTWMDYSAPSGLADRLIRGRARIVGRTPSSASAFLFSISDIGNPSRPQETTARQATFPHPRGSVQTPAVSHPG